MFSGCFFFVFVVHLTSLHQRIAREKSIINKSDNDQETKKQLKPRLFSWRLQFESIMFGGRQLNAIDFDAEKQTRSWDELILESKEKRSDFHKWRQMLVVVTIQFSSQDCRFVSLFVQNLEIGKTNSSQQHGQKHLEIIDRARINWNGLAHYGVSGHHQQLLIKAP